MTDEKVRKSSINQLKARGAAVNSEYSQIDNTIDDPKEKRQRAKSGEAKELKRQRTRNRDNEESEGDGTKRGRKRANYSDEED